MSSLESRLVCRGCGARIPPDEPRPFRCPNAVDGDDVDHVVARELQLEGARLPLGGDPQPFVRFRELLHSWRFARGAGASDAELVARIHQLDAAVARVAGTGFVCTPYREARALGRACGIEALWIKDETGNVAGSHKARHLFGLALYLRAVGLPADTRLAIASCGNAAVAAGVVAQAAGWPLDAYVPPHADPEVLARLQHHGVTIVRCPRRAEDPPGDPCFLRLREAVRGGAVPFTCQGSENGLTIEGGQTLGWELIAQHAQAQAPPIGAVAIQVGGGALGTAVVEAFREGRALGALARLPRFFPVQSAGAHPFERAWRRLALDVVEAAGTPDAPGPEAAAPELAGWLHARRDAAFFRATVERAPRRRSRYMRPWGVEPHSVATGILDDETYDWFALVRATLESGGWPLVVSDATLERACTLARKHTAVPVGPTGAAGLAGLLELERSGAFERGTSTVALFTGRY